MNASDTVVAALVSGGITLLVLVLNRVFGRRREEAAADLTEAEALKVDAEAAAIVQAGLERYIDRLEERDRVRDERMANLELRVDELEEALRVERAQTRNLSRLLRSTCRWALTLRDEVLKLGGVVPPMPADVEFALTTLDAE